MFLNFFFLTEVPMIKPITPEEAIKVQIEAETHIPQTEQIMKFDKEGKYV